MERAQAALAEAATTIVVAGPYISLDPTNDIGAALEGRGLLRPNEPFDFISGAPILRIMADRERRRALIQKIKMFVSLRQPERVLLVDTVPGIEQAVHRLHETLTEIGAQERWAKQVTVAGVTISSPEPIDRATALVLTCPDFRLHGARGVVSFLREKGALDAPVQIITIPGALDVFRNENPEREPRFVNRHQLARIALSDIEAFVQSGVAHGPHQVIVVPHKDCAAKGGSKAFGNDSRTEHHHLLEDVIGFKRCLTRVDLHHVLAVRAFYAQCEGTRLTGLTVETHGHHAERTHQDEPRRLLA